MSGGALTLVDPAREPEGVWISREGVSRAVEGDVWFDEPFGRASDELEACVAEESAAFDDVRAGECWSGPPFDSFAVDSSSFESVSGSSSSGAGDSSLSGVDAREGMAGALASFAESLGRGEAASGGADNGELPWAALSGAGEDVRDTAGLLLGEVGEGCCDGCGGCCGTGDGL